MSASPIISVRNLFKNFGSVQALDNVTLDIDAGHIIGLMGANGGGNCGCIR